MHPDLALLQREEEAAERAAAASTSGEAGTPPSADREAELSGRAGGGPITGTEPTPQPAGHKNTRFFGVAKVNPERYARDLTRLSQEIIQHLASADGVELEIRVEIAARKPDGYPDDKVRNVTENARTLKFESYGFEDR